MGWSLSEMQAQMAAVIDISGTAPTEGDSDWSLRLRALNRAQVDLQEAYDWRWALKTINTLTSQATGNVTVTLPSDFRKLATSPNITWDGATSDRFPEINLVDVNKYVSSDKFVYVLGNPRDNYSFIVHASDLASGASINYSYYSTLPSLVSGSDQTMAPDPTYLVQKATAYVLSASGDNRFPVFDAKADDILARLIEKENVRGDNFDDRIKTKLESRSSFRLGRD